MIDLFTLAKSYNFSEVQVTLGGYRIGGFGDDGGCSIEFEGDEASMSQGADGEVTVNQLPATPAVCTITLKETSVSNAVLAGLRATQRAAPAGFIMPFALVDLTTGESLVCPQAAFANRPNMGKGKEAGDREWKILLPAPQAVYASL